MTTLHTSATVSHFFYSSALCTVKFFFKKRCEIKIISKEFSGGKKFISLKEYFESMRHLGYPREDKYAIVLLYKQIFKL